MRGFVLKPWILTLSHSDGVGMIHSVADYMAMQIFRCELRSKSAQPTSLIFPNMN